MCKYVLLFFYLIRGVTPNVWGAGSAWGLYFLFYNSLKTWWQGGDTRKGLFYFVCINY